MSWVLMILSIVATRFCSGRWPYVGWVINLFGESLWIVWGALSHQWGFVFGGLTLFVLFLRNAYNEFKAWGERRAATA